MRRKIIKARFSPRALHHIYVRCRDRGVLFYTVKDRLVYYTLAAVHSRKKNVRVVAASFMFTHLHLSVSSETEENLSCYARNSDSAFTRLYNSHHERTDGSLLDRPLGHSVKYSSKDQRSNIIYVFNNHVEKGLCTEAVKERWSFLAYAFSDHPFSRPIDFRNVSKPMMKALKLVDRRIVKNKALEYVDLDSIFPSLDDIEKEQFIDYVISRYALIDFSAAASHFGSLDDMVTAINSTTGGEFDINEDFTNQKDTGYVNLLRFASRQNFLDKIFSMDGKSKFNWIMKARLRVDASDDQLRRFFHYDFRRM